MRYVIKADMNHPNPEPVSCSRLPNAAERRLGAVGRIAEVGSAALAQARRRSGAAVAGRALARQAAELAAARRKAGAEVARQALARAAAPVRKLNVAETERAVRSIRLRTRCSLAEALRAVQSGVTE